MPKLKIAVLFRGPVRPTAQDAAQRCYEFLQQFRNAQDLEITTYLATWSRWKQQRAVDLIATDLFDNVIMQAEPTDAQIERATLLKHLPNGAEIRPVFNMYYQSKTALDVIHAADDYDYIVHTRTDMVMQFGDFDKWFVPNTYTAPHVTGVFAPHAPHIPAEQMFMCDQFGIAPAAVMHAAWDYGTIAQLGVDIEAAGQPEHVLQNRIDKLGISVAAPPFVAWQLDPRRNW